MAPRLFPARTAFVFLWLCLTAGAIARAQGPLSPAPPPEQFDRRPVRLPPILWYEKDPETRRRLFMLSLIYWDVADDDSSHRLLLPVFYRWQEEDRSLLVSLPFVLSYKSMSERWLVAGLFYRQKNNEKARTALFPLYWQKSRIEGGRTSVLFPFLFYDYRSRHRDRVDQVNLLGWRRKRPEKSMGMTLNYWWANEKDRGLFLTLFPLYWRFESPGDRLDFLTPLYLRRKDEENRRWAGVFPLAGMGWGNKLNSSYVFPLYYYSRLDDNRELVTLPFSRRRERDLTQGHVALYYYSHDPDRRTDGVFPIWHHRRDTDGFEKKTRLFNYYAHLENEDYFQTFFPLYGYWSSPEKSQFLSWGVWWTKGPDAASGWAGPYYWKRDGPDTTRVFFPLYWHFWRSPDWRMDVVFPFYSRYRDGDTRITIVPPIIVRQSGDRRTVSLLFLYWKDRETDRRSLSFFPLFHYSVNPRGRMFYSPILWTRRSPLSREGIFPPFYWYRSQEARRTVVFPLYWNTRSPDKSLNIVPPYYRWRYDERRAHGFFPLWGKHSDDKTRGGYLMPFYWYTKNNKGDSLWIIPPLLAYVSKQGQGTENPRFSMQYLLLGNIQRSTNTFEHDFFPLYRYVRRDDFRNFWAPRVLPIVAWEKDARSSKGYVFPYLWKRSPAKDWDLFIPLWYHSSEYSVIGSTEDDPLRDKRIGGASIFFPIYWAGSNAEREYRYVMPLYAHYAEGPRRFSTLFPIWYSYNGNTGRKFRLFFPVYWRFLLKGKPEKETPELLPERDIIVTGPWFRTETRVNGERRSRTVGLAPFFSSTTGGPGDRYFEVLGGLFARDVQDGKRRFRLLYFFYTKPR